ncbi:hypothetical protein [Cohnella caldifontis]|uniref:hypothetical protein n=1 Tax=Cohnella caldifontis TaxID=3027471 RepID=UPI0023EDE010|nr:hypothetical protein [Cohnella sp. YIM B05605]
MNRQTNPRADSFETWWKRVDRGLRTAVWILAVLLLLFQSALQSPAIRSFWSSADRLEGIPYAQDPGR